MHDPGEIDEPAFLSREGDPAMFDREKKPASASGALVWWEGRWPENGVNDLAGLEVWLAARLDEFVLCRQTMPGSIRWMDEALGRQAITNAIRFLNLRRRTAGTPCDGKA